MNYDETVKAETLANEITFSVSRSGGAGGQNVNKVNSKVTLYFDIRNSSVLTEAQKAALESSLASRLTSDGVLIIVSQESRSQAQNRETAIEKLEILLAKGLKRRKARKKTKPSKTSVRNRLRKKKVASEKKKWRRKPGAD